VTTTFSDFFSKICVGHTVRSTFHPLVMDIIDSVPFPSSHLSCFQCITVLFNNSLQAANASLDFLQRSFQLANHVCRIDGLWIHAMLLLHKVWHQVIMMLNVPFKKFLVIISLQREYILT